MLHLGLVALLALGMTIGLQRAIVQNVLTTAAGATAQTGAVYALPQDWSGSDELMYQIVISGGVFSGLTVNIALSLDGVNFPVNQVADNSHLGNIGIVQMGAALSQVKAPFLQASIAAGVISSGSPVVTVNVWPR